MYRLLNFTLSSFSIALVAAGFLSVSTAMTQPAAASQAFTLENYFQGKTYAKGKFVSKIGHTERSFDVFLSGKWNGKTLTLREDFVYSDGEKDRKTWRFTKTAPGHYTGTREDVIGTTKVTIKGNVAKFNYDVLLPREGKKPIRVHFRDVLVLKPNGVLENKANVSKLGLPIAKVAVNFVRPEDRSKLKKPTL